MKSCKKKIKAPKGVVLLKHFDNKYGVTKRGKVWGSHYKKFIEPAPNELNMVEFRLSVDGERVVYPRYKLLAMGFVPNPHNYKYARHKDGHGYNDKLSNIEWFDN